MPGRWRAGSGTRWTTDLPPGVGPYATILSLAPGSVVDDLLDHVGPAGRLHGRYGTVTRTRRERRQAKDDDVVLAALDEAGVPRDWVLGVDEEKLDVVVAATDVDAADGNPRRPEFVRAFRVSVR